MHALTRYGNAAETAAAVLTPSYFRGGVCEPQLPAISVGNVVPGLATTVGSSGQSINYAAAADTIKLNIAAHQKEVADAEAQIKVLKQQKTTLQATMKSISDAYVAAHAKQKAMREQFWKSQASKNVRSMQFAHEHGTAVRNLILRLVEQQDDATLKMDEMDRLIQEAKYKRVSARLNLVKETAEAKRQLELDILENERNLEKAMAVARYKPAYSTTKKNRSKKRALKHRRSSTSSSDSSSIEDESDEDGKRSRSSRSSSDSGSDSSQHRNKKKDKKEKHAGTNDPANSTRKLIAAKTELLKLQKVREQLANKLRRLESHKGAGHLLSGGGHWRNIRDLEKELEHIDGLIRQHEAVVRYYDTFASTGVPSAGPVLNQAVSQAPAPAPAATAPVATAPINAPLVKAVAVHQQPYIDDDSNDDFGMFRPTYDDLNGDMQKLIGKPVYRVCPDGRRDFVAFMGFQANLHGGVRGSTKRTKARKQAAAAKAEAAAAVAGNDAAVAGNDAAVAGNDAAEAAVAGNDAAEAAAAGNDAAEAAAAGNDESNSSDSSETNSKTSELTSTHNQYSFEGYIKKRLENPRKYVPHGKGIYTGQRDQIWTQYRGTFYHKPATEEDDLPKTTFTGLVLRSQDNKRPLLHFYTKANVRIVYTTKPFTLEIDEDANKRDLIDATQQTDNVASSTVNDDDGTHVSTFVFNRWLAVITTTSTSYNCTEVVWWEEDCFTNMRLQIYTSKNNHVSHIRSGCGFDTVYGKEGLPSIAQKFNKTYRPQNSLPSASWIRSPFGDANTTYTMEYRGGNENKTLNSVPAGMVVFGLPHGFNVQKDKKRNKALRAYVNGSLFGSVEYKKKGKDEQDDDEDDEPALVKQHVRMNDNTFASKEYTKTNRLFTVAGGQSDESESDLNGGSVRRTKDKKLRKSKLDPKWIAEFENYCTKLARNFKTLRVDERESLLNYVAIAIENVQQALRTDTRLETRNQLARPAHLLLEAMAPCANDNLAFSESFKLACSKLKQLFPPLVNDEDDIGDTDA